MELTLAWLKLSHVLFLTPSHREPSHSFRIWINHHHSFIARVLCLWRPFWVFKKSGKGGKIRKFSEEAITYPGPRDFLLFFIAKFAPRSASFIFLMARSAESRSALRVANFQIKKIILKESLWDQGITYVPVKSTLQHPPLGHTPGNWRLFLPGRAGIWSLASISCCESCWFHVVDKSWRRRRRQTLMNSKEKIAYSWRIGWKPKAYTSFVLYLKVFKTDLYLYLNM